MCRYGPFSNGYTTARFYIIAHIRTCNLPALLAHIEHAIKRQSAARQKTFLVNSNQRSGILIKKLGKLRFVQATNLSALH